MKTSVVIIQGFCSTKCISDMHASLSRKLVLLSII